MRKALLALFLVIVPISALAQNRPCALPLSSAPVVRGLRLNMNVSEMRSWLGVTRKKRSIPKQSYYERYFPEGYYYLNFDARQLSDPTFDGWNRFTLNITDRLLEFQIEYINSGVWGNFDEFLNHTIEYLGFPDKRYWGVGKDIASLYCSGFMVYVFFSEDFLRLSVRDNGFSEKTAAYRKRVQKRFRL